jgi:hypothetical protein
MAYQKGELYSPVEFYWPKNTGLPEAFEDPLVAEFVPNPNLVDAEGNRRTFSPHLNLSLTLEDSLRSNAININEVIIHIWRLNQILQEDPSQVTASLFAGFIRLYFPLLDDIEILDDAMSNEADEASESYAACQVYVGDRQQQLMHLQTIFKEHNGLNLISCRSIESLHVKIPKILPLPESLEILFFELKLSTALPYLRYFSDTPDQEPIMRYLKDVYLPPDILSNWLKELPETKNKVIVGKVLIRGSKIPLGSAFDIAFLSDNTNTAKLETTRKDSPYPGHTVEEGLLELRGFIENNTFNHEFEPLELSYLHGRFNWKHPNPTSPKPTITELKRRIEKYSHLFDIEPADPTEPTALKLRYRAVSNYESENEIFRYISRLLALKVTEKDVRKAETTEYVIAELGKRFGRGRDQAQTDYLAYLERSGQFKAAVQGGGDDAVPAYHDGVFVSLRNTHPEYEIEVANVQEKTSCSRIFTTLVVMLLEGADGVEGPKLETGSAIVAEAKALVKQENEGQKESELSAGTRASAGMGGEGNEEALANYLDLFTGAGDEPVPVAGPPKAAEEAPLGTVPIAVTAQIPAEALATRGSSAEVTPQPAKALPKEEIGKSTQFYISRLKFLDEDLFGYKTKDVGSGYSRRCPYSDGKQPYGITPEQYARIKETYKDKVTFIEGPKPGGWKMEKDHPGVTKDAKGYYDTVKRRRVWITLKAGYSPNKKNWFMCTKYWCKNDDLPLLEEEFERAHACPFCGGLEVTDEKEPKKGETVIVRKVKEGMGLHQFIGFSSTIKNPEQYKLPCCGKLFRPDSLILEEPYKEEPKLAAATAAAAVVAAAAGGGGGAVELSPAAEEDEEERATVFSMSSSIRSTASVDITKILGNLQSKYIKSANKYPLNAGDLGLVTKQVDTMFGQDSSKAVQKEVQQKLKRDQLVFVRFGIQNTALRPGDRFLSMLGFFMQNMNLDSVIAAMSTPVFIKAFEDANYGTLVHEFARPDLTVEPKDTGFETFIRRHGDPTPHGRSNVLRLYYAYQNFMNYVKDPFTVKDIRYFEHLLMMPDVFFVDKPGILLIRIERDMEKDEWTIECPSFGLPDMITMPTPVFVIHDPKYQIWEPLILYNGVDKGIIRFHDMELRDKLKPDVKDSLKKWVESILKRGVACGRISTPPHIWTPADVQTKNFVPTIKTLLSLPSPRPTSIVRDRTNRFVGFMYKSITTNREFYVPARDDGSAVHQYKRIYESSSIPLQTQSDVIRFYKDSGLDRIPALMPAFFLSTTDEEGEFYVGVELKSGAMIPTQKTNDHPPAGLPVKPISQFPWKMDETIFPYTVPLNNESIELQTADTFLNEAYQYLRLLLANYFRRTEDGEKVLINLETIRKKYTLPLWERRASAEGLLYPVVKSHVKATPYKDILDGMASKQKTLPRIRKDCGDPTLQADTCPVGICKWIQSEDGGKGRCMLHAPETKTYPDPVRLFTIRVIDEILRNPYAFKEIEENRVSRIKPLKGTIQTETEIFTTESTDHVRSLQEQAARKIQKTKYYSY